MPLWHVAYFELKAIEKNRHMAPGLYHKGQNNLVMGDSSRPNLQHWDGNLGTYITFTNWPYLPLVLPKSWSSLHRVEQKYGDHYGGEGKSGFITCQSKGNTVG